MKIKEQVARDKFQLSGYLKEWQRNRLGKTLSRMQESTIRVIHNVQVLIKLFTLESFPYIDQQ